MEDRLKNTWFYNKIYKPQHFGKLLHIWAEEGEDSNPEITNIHCEDWDASSLDNKEKATFIAAFSKGGDLLFVYNVPNRTMHTPTSCITGNNPNKLLEFLGDYVSDFYKGDKLEDYKFRTVRKEIIENLFNYEGRQYYIISTEKIEREYPHGHNDPIEYYNDTKYTLYDGEYLIDLEVDSMAGNADITRKIKCNLPDVDNKMEKYKIHLGKI